MAIKLSLLSNKKGINVLTKKKLFVTKREKEKIKAKHTSVLAFKFQLETALLPPLQTVAAAARVSERREKGTLRKDRERHRKKEKDSKGRERKRKKY